MRCFTVAGAALLLAATVSLPGIPSGADAGDGLRVRGRVTVQGCGVAGVVVTDGVGTAVTASDGSFVLSSRAGRTLRVLRPDGRPLPRVLRGAARVVGPRVELRLAPMSVG